MWISADETTEFIPLTAQLHHFADVSQVGYGTVSYLRLLRVAPLKQITIPRLELTAAVLAVHVDKLLWKQINFKLENPVFWTDSTTVLKHIYNETKGFQTFVANSHHHQRVYRCQTMEICELEGESSWWGIKRNKSRHLPERQQMDKIEFL